MPLLPRKALTELLCYIVLVITTMAPMQATAMAITALGGEVSWCYSARVLGAENADSPDPSSSRSAHLECETFCASAATSALLRAPIVVSTSDALSRNTVAAVPVATTRTTTELSIRGPPASNGVTD